MTRFLTRNRLTLSVIALLILAGIESVLRPEPTPVETAAVGRGPLRVTVDAEGKTRVRDRFVVTAPVSGRLERVMLDEGAQVRAGDVVARIAPAPLDEPSARQARARVDAARALAAEAATRARLAEAAADQARRDHERTQRLADAGAIPRRALEEAALAARSRADDLTAALAHAAAAAAEVDQASAGLLYAGVGAGGEVPVRAPAAGRVLRIAERSARLVPPGAMIAEIGDTRALEVVVDVLSSDAARIRPGMTVLLEGWGGAECVQGTVRLVEPAATTRVSALGVEEQRVDVLVDVVDPPAALGDAYRVDASVIVWERDGVLTVPASALVRSGNAWAAYIVAGGRAALRTVEVGEMGGATAQVLSGLREGEQVIVFPSDQVRGGVRVAVR